MKCPPNLLSLVIAIVSSWSIAEAVQADLVVTVFDSGGTVVVSSVGGVVNTTGLAIDRLSGAGFDGTLRGGVNALETGVFANTNGLHPIFVDGSSTITRTTTGGFTTGTFVGAGTFLVNEEAVALQDTGVFRIWLTNGATVGQNQIDAFQFALNQPNSISNLGFTAGSSLTYDWGQDSITFRVIPEPTSCLVLFGAMTPLMACYRRRRSLTR